MTQVTMDIKSFVRSVQLLPSNISVLARGRHGIGKSQCFYQIAESLGLNVIERRLSQMTEGDMIGLPELINGTTRFAHPDWYAQACETPVVLFLDEINRATPEVMQAAFQIVLDHELNGKKLHPNTRVYAAVNADHEYNVNDMDPAFVDRFFVVDLKPTQEEWLDWASINNNVHPTIVDFIRVNSVHLEYEGIHQPGGVYPSRRSWKRLSDVLIVTELATSPEKKEYYDISRGFVGPEASMSLIDHVKDLTKQVCAEDVLDGWCQSIKTKILSMGNEGKNIVIERINSYIKQLGDDELTDIQIDNYARFFWNLDDELKIAAWNSLMQIIVKDKNNQPRKSYLGRIHTRPQIQYGTVYAYREMIMSTNKGMKLDDVLPPRPKDENDGLSSPPPTNVNVVAEKTSKKKTKKQ